ncbi:PP2C family protein-serine/threonine phosphatase [Nonomuraea sp. PA05]|uniref:PP2C family protein-serine/threonine phosphatase n=1 Tax=Nonomuraea sp. PA05 TaxID=2604466 RepID=UPI0021CCA15C|nr:PP2C family protein-serine/threonine phosphatase [Nonomuraea sp. PA05]
MTGHDGAAASGAAEPAPARGAEHTAARAAMFGALISASHTSTLEQIPALVAEQAARVGLHDVLIYLADLQQEVLSPLVPRPAPAGAAERGEICIEGTVAGRAFQHGRTMPASVRDPRQWWVPLVDGTDRLGVLRISAPGADPATIQDMERLAGLVALLVVSKRPLSDTYARLVRRRRMSVSAEMEWRLMPQRTFATDRLVISAVMEPAYDVSGDVYDYAFEGTAAHLAIFDAMGHDTAAGLTANLALTTLRNSRHEGQGLVRAARRIDQALMGQFGGERFATGVLATLDIPSGELTWVNCGHHPPVIVRRRATIELACEPGPPAGTGLGLPVTQCHDQLQPGDRLLLYTDGITEARNRQGEEFGMERFTDFLIRHQADELPVPETLRRLILHHLDYHERRLRDDATVLLVEWPGTPYTRKEAEALTGVPEGSDGLF